MTTEPTLEYRDEQPYVAIRTQVTMQELGMLLPPLHGDVFGFLARKGIAPAGAPFWRYRVVDVSNRPVNRAACGATPSPY